MEKDFKKELEKIVNIVPAPKVLFALVVAIILGVILYLSILFLMSK
jgi:hypothetical protein